ncbi:MAG: polyprenyl synthetase family protein [Butyrivibrio sp.]|nr:polyprenyl synthetase family protein [Muribaculum sp.]MCM1551997.1 polyprenyl synthetase family protein [Butyrivibrio sp.]
MSHEMRNESQNNNGQLFQVKLAERAARVEELLRKYLPDEQYAPKTIVDAMNYSLMAGGKRLRPILMQEMYQMFGGVGHGIEYFMAAIEMIHTYSLVHDDLPAMDNDEYRRGRKTTWAVYGDAMGILAGDGLLNYAFETAVQAFNGCRTVEDYQRVASALRVLGFNAGIGGMIGGQTADIEAEQQSEPLTEEQIIYIHTHKTGALIKAAMMIGAVLAGMPREWKAQLGQCAMDIGIAFQIQDDILDVTGDSEELGKPVGSDAANGKQTYVTLHGVEAAGVEVERLSNEAIELLRSMPGDSSFMEDLVDYLIHRRY